MLISILAVSTGLTGEPRPANISRFMLAWKTPGVLRSLHVAIRFVVRLLTMVGSLNAMILQIFSGLQEHVSCQQADLIQVRSDGPEQKYRTHNLPLSAAVPTQLTT